MDFDDVIEDIAEGNFGGLAIERIPAHLAPGATDEPGGSQDGHQLADMGL
jgi:hypothetical protein